MSGAPHSEHGSVLSTVRRSSLPENLWWGSFQVGSAGTQAVALLVVGRCLQRGRRRDKLTRAEQLIKGLFLEAHSRMNLRALSF